MAMALTFMKRFPECIHSCLKNDIHGCVILTATLKLKVPAKYDHVKYPERRRLKIIDKVPPLEPSVRPPKHMRDLYRMRGPETIHNKLQYGDYGIQVMAGGRMTHKDCETVRMIIVRQMDDRYMFAAWRINQLWQSVTRKGLGTRMGGGKPSIDHYVVPVRAERILLEVGGECEFVEVYPMLRAIQKVLPFRNRIVTHESMRKREEMERQAEANNKNIFTFKYAVENNILGCHKILNRYDYIWHNKYQ